MDHEPQALLLFEAAWNQDRQLASAAASDPPFFFFFTSQLLLQGIYLSCFFPGGLFKFFFVFSIILYFPFDFEGTLFLTFKFLFVFSMLFFPVGFLREPIALFLRFLVWSAKGNEACWSWPQQLDLLYFFVLQIK